MLSMITPLVHQTNATASSESHNKNCLSPQLIPVSIEEAAFSQSAQNTKAINIFHY